MTVVVSPFGDATTYQYLNNDLTQSATMGNDVATSYDYDTGNRIRSITHRRLSDGADLGSFTYEYDANSNRVKLSFSGDAVPPFDTRVGRVPPCGPDSTIPPHGPSGLTATANGRWCGAPNTYGFRPDL